MEALFDTNILIDYLNGYNEAKLIIEQYQNPQISIITKIEILVGATESDNDILREFLHSFSVIALNEEIAEIAVKIRQENKVKLPDAIIWASAKYKNSLLITRNTKDFSIHSPDIKIPYNI